ETFLSTLASDRRSRLEGVARQGCQGNIEERHSPKADAWFLEQCRSVLWLGKRRRFLSQSLSRLGKRRVSRFCRAHDFLDFCESRARPGCQRKVDPRRVSRQTRAGGRSDGLHAGRGWDWDLAAAGSGL